MADDKNDAEERFLKANANADFMANRLAECLRNCMRAVAGGDSSSGVYRAAQDFDILLKLLVHSEGVRLSELFGKAIEEIKPSPLQISGEWLASKDYDHAIISAAQSGLQLLVESSCADNAARGRASQRERSFLQSIKDIEEARQEMVREADEKWKSRKPMSVKKPRKNAKRLLQPREPL